ncbi:MAG TPA: xanthine dehydrogenase family protein subunit M [Rhizomicrobium sp.]|jgi:xanthine dehydrogenase YagS FAD-binding subunit|nr:xanthine dehydrogenase family protein subunit M [Rhizomicrobium sp.]
MRAFDYVRAADAAAAIRLAGPDTSYLAGGTTLLDLAKLDVMRPHTVVDVNDVRSQFGAIASGPDGVHLGAFVHMAEAAEHPAILAGYPVVAQSLQLAASQQIRNMATLGGNVLQRTRCSYFRDPSWANCNKRIPGSGCAALTGVNRKHAVLGTSEGCIATYPGDFAQALIALDASVDIVGAGGPRVLRFADLHVAPGATPERETTLAPGDLITGFTLPPLAWAKRSLYLKIRDRQSYEFALASAAVALDLDGGRVRAARIALGGVATKPWRARGAEAALAGKPVTEDSAAQAAETAFAGAAVHGENAFKIDLGKRTLTRALVQVAAMEV